MRVRGTVEIWRGPILDIAAADLIEVLEGRGVPGNVVRGDGAQGDVGGEPQRR